MFFLRSAFWLTLMFSSMPFEGETSRPAEQAGPTVSTTGYAERAAACDSALRSFVAPCPAAPASPGSDLSGQKSSAGTRCSADSLTAEDRAMPWRGRPGNSGA
jgi:hypothetical protein